MTIADENDSNSGMEMYELIKELYPICRSITGNGVRKTLDIIRKHISLKVSEIPTGTTAYDWEVPKEWNIRDAYVRNQTGRKVIDWKKSNLHVLNYSIPVKRKMQLKELGKHLFTLPEQPNLIPYLTSYYKDNWGFCLSHNELKKLTEGEYEVVIDSTLKPGHLTYGELFLPGELKEEILFSTYICHPSLCNDNLTGPAILTFLAKTLLSKPLRYSYRFLFIPETIGAIVWLSRNEKAARNIKGGLIATCLGDSGNITYKQSKEGDNYIDRVVKKVLIDSNNPHKIIKFFPTGSDERQFSSPGFNIPTGSLTRTLYGYFPEYHTSADNLQFVKPACLEGSLMCYRDVVAIMEGDATVISKNQKGEPQLGKRGLYSEIGGKKDNSKLEEAMLWVLSFADGRHSILEIATISCLPFSVIKKASSLLATSLLVEEIPFK
jgi:aminopeptidase-like protein